MEVRTAAYTALETALHGRDDGHALMRLVIDAGADVDARGFIDWTPLHAAVSANDPEAVALLLAAGAVTAGRVQCAEVLRGHG